MRLILLGGDIKRGKKFRAKDLRLGTEEDLKDKVVGYTDESGVQIPPLHPRCRCAIRYDEEPARSG